jgi:hypothetical protein
LEEFNDKTPGIPAPGPVQEATISTSGIQLTFQISNKMVIHGDYSLTARATQETIDF